MVVVYITVCLLLTFEQSISKFQSYTEAVASLKSDPGTILLDKFEMNSEEYLYSLKNHTVAADTLIYGMHSDENGLYLITGITNQKDQRILLKLSVNSEIIKNNSKIRYKKALLTAKINNVLKLPYQKKIYSFENEIVWENQKYDIMLEGSLSELLYISPIHG